MKEDLIMQFVNYLISETCQGCTECNPLSNEKQNVVCVCEGECKWYVQKAKEFIRSETVNS